MPVQGCSEASQSWNPRQPLSSPSMVGSLMAHLPAPRAPLQNPQVPPGSDSLSQDGDRGRGPIRMGKLDGPAYCPVQGALASPGLVLA